jgi:PAS domain S-box-containing protein
VHSESETRVLLAAATAKDGEITRSLLAAERLRCVVCQNLAQLTAEIDGGVGAILLTEEAFEADGLDELLAKLNRQPSWSDIPVVILMRSDHGWPVANRVLGSLTNVTLLERPAPTRSVVSAVQAAVRGRVRQYQIRQQFEEIAADRKLAEERDRQAMAEAMATAEANAKFRTFFDQGTYFAGVMTPDGTIIEANRLCLDASGFTRDQVIGKKFWECGWWNRSPALVELVKNGSMQAAAGHLFQTETAYFVADGSQRVVDLIISPVTDDTGKILFVAPTGTDITDKKRLADEREKLLEAERAARADAEQAGRLKDEFLATLSHELRTPLNAILGWAHILRRRKPEDAELNEGLLVIERNSRAQAKLIEDLLDMSRIVSGKLRLDIQQVIAADITNAAIESVRPAAEAKEIRLEKVLDTHIGPIRGDPARLQQVMWNLLSNAIKFTPKGGKVQVAVQLVNSHVEISVTDTGVGIKAEFIPYVFERFRQADASITRKHGGLGLGLAIVKNLVELHGGKVRAKSPGEGCGATFVVELPLMVVHESESISQHEHPKSENLAGPAEFICEQNMLLGVKVLVVDDEEDARTLIARVLEECDATVLLAASGAQAREILMRERPTVLISDVGMPSEDGYEFIRRVRLLPDHQGGKTPAAALTAFARSEDRTRALRAGYQSHLSKPVEPTELITVVASLAGRTGPSSTLH